MSGVMHNMGVLKNDMNIYVSNSLNKMLFYTRGFLNNMHFNVLSNESDLKICISNNSNKTVFFLKKI
jgi:hypothetical protein